MAAWLFALTLGGCAQTVIHERDGMFGRIVVEQDTAGIRTLVFEPRNGRQSIVKPGDPDHLEFAYAQSVLAGFGLIGAPSRILVLGLGGGSMPMFFRSNFPEARVEVAEIDPAVVEVARAYFGLREDERLRVVVGDARKTVEAAAPGTYDMILADAFNASSVPPHLTTREFLLAVARALKPSGVLVSNIWRLPFNARYEDMMATHIDVFPEVRVIDVPSDVNSVVFALPRPSGIDREEFIRRAARVAETRKFRYAVGEIVRYREVPLESLGIRGQVLRDPPRQP